MIVYLCIVYLVRITAVVDETSVRRFSEVGEHKEYEHKMKDKIGLKISARWKRGRANLI
jgi:hypothetical protein